MEGKIKQTSVVKSIEKIVDNFEKLKNKSKTIEKIADIWIKALSSENKIIFCGNGGSAADSQHLAAELIGRYKIDRDPIPAISLTTDTSILTAIGNDYGFDKVFSRALRGVGKSGDVLVGISTSGNSKNVIDAFAIAKQKGIITIAFTGKDGGEMKKVADVTLNAPSTATNNIQEMHIAVGHIVCGVVERHFFVM